MFQFYNAGGLHCAAAPGSTEDGYAAGANPALQACAPHDSDYLPSGPDWRIDFSELLRLILFYNAGGYYHCPDAATEDGFYPGSP